MYSAKMLNFEALPAQYVVICSLITGVVSAVESSKQS